MDQPTSVSVPGTLLATFIDQAAAPAPSSPSTEVVRCQLSATFTDRGEDPARPRTVLRNFVILFKEPAQTVTVQGTGLQYIPAGGGHGIDPGSYAVQVVEGGKTVIVALIPAGQVRGIFAGRPEALSSVPG